MPLYEVETSLVIHCKVKVTVMADSKEAAIDAAADELPQNHNQMSRLWNASVVLKPPGDVSVKFVKAYHFEQSSGTDKAKLVR